jgi:hypothetical protein
LLLLLPLELLVRVLCVDERAGGMFK